MALARLTISAVLTLQLTRFEASLVSMGIEATVSEELRHAMLADGSEAAGTSSQSKARLLRPQDVTTSLRGKEVINEEHQDPDKQDSDAPSPQSEGKEADCGGYGPAEDGKPLDSPCRSSAEAAPAAAEEAELTVEKVQFEVASSEVLGADLRVVGAGIGGGATGAAVAAAASATTWKLPLPTALGLRTLAILAVAVAVLTRLVGLVISVLHGSAMKPGSVDKPV